MGHSLEFILNHPVLSVALFIFIYLIVSYEIKNFTKKYKGINCSDLVTKINESQIVVLDTREKTEYKKYLQKKNTFSKFFKKIKNKLKKLNLIN